MTIIRIIIVFLFWVSVMGNVGLLMWIFSLKGVIQRMAGRMHQNAVTLSESQNSNSVLLSRHYELFQERDKYFTKYMNEKKERENLEKVILGMDPGYEFTMST
jgi:hypothetical protein